MASLKELIPDVDILLELEPEELAAAVLIDLNSKPSPVRPKDYIVGLFQLNREVYPHEKEPAIRNALLEAFAWLINQVLIAEDHEPSGPREFFVTRRGKKIASKEDFDAFRQASMLPKKLLHPTIAEKCWLTFIRGDFDAAVFQAFKEVEVAVRRSGKFADKDIGTALMRKAFELQVGPLTDKSLPAAEQESLAHLFAGAIGSYKNAQSHRTVAITDAGEAIEMIVLASHLLRIVDARAAATPA